ncbi:26S proteasome non-ATPase regulatory subunit 11 [Diplonema papillatum]|nr:26S proteasome non-ATPase regulatory subunit 11 [Diplonema papillatum]
MPGDVEMTDVEEEKPHELEIQLGEAAATKDKELYKKIITCTASADDVRAVRAKESAVFSLGKLLVAEKNVEGMRNLLTDVRPFFDLIAKSRTARIIRRLFDMLSASGVSHEDQLVLVEEMIAWAKREKRSFLRQRLQTRLGELRFQLHRYMEALQGVNILLREVRRLDDKQMLVDVHVLESRLYYALKNSSKAKAALVAARTAAHSIYVGPLTQAEIDMQSGIISAEEKDFKVAYSYFFESFEGFHGTGEHRPDAEAALKYMLMSKILDASLSDMSQVLQQKSVTQYRGLDAVTAMTDIAEAYKTRDLHKFNSVRKVHAGVFAEDDIAETHLDDLYNELLEKHLLRVIEPYERVEIAHLAEQIKLAPTLIESKLSQMILDDKLKGILDQAHHCLIVHPDDTKDLLFTDAVGTLESLHKVIDALFDKCAGKFLKDEKKDKDKKDEKDKDKKDEKDKDGDKEKEKEKEKEGTEKDKTNDKMDTK